MGTLSSRGSEAEEAVAPVVAEADDADADAALLRHCALCCDQCAVWHSLQVGRKRQGGASSGVVMGAVMRTWTWMGPEWIHR
jgi:hypothetical protein